MNDQVLEKTVTNNAVLFYPADKLGGLGSEHRIIGKNSIVTDMISDKNRHTGKSGTNTHTKFGINVVQGSHGNLTATNYGRFEPITEKDDGRYVELRVYPEEGYFLKGVKILTKSGIEVRRYDGADSFGFEMPKADVTLIPEFCDKALTVDIPSADRIYREIRDFKNGRYTGMSLYVPFEIKGIPETCSHGEKPRFIVKSADGTELCEGNDYTVAEASEKSESGIRHILIFEGKGSPAKDSGGYFTGNGEVYKGKQVVVYTEKYKSAYSKLPDLMIGGNKAMQFGRDYCFTPPADSTYCFAFDKPDALYVKVLIKSDDTKVQTVEGTVNNGMFITELKGGVTYSVTTKASYNIDELKALDVFIDEYIPHSITVIKPENGLLAVVASGASADSAYRGETADIRIAPSDGYYLKSLNIISADNKPVGIVDCFYTYLFTMPDTDVFVTAEFADASSALKKIPEDRIYRETEVYSNGRRTDAVQYITVEISGVADTYVSGMSPRYFVRTADNIVLNEGEDFTVRDEIKITNGCVSHELTFDGTGTVYKGEQVVTYIEIPSEQLTAGRNEIRPFKAYVFTPEESGKFRLTYTDNELNKHTRVISDDGDIDTEVSGASSVTFELEAGKCYEFSFSSDSRKIMSEVFEVCLEKLRAYKLTVAKSRYGTVEADSFESENRSDGKIVAGEIAALWVYPDEDCRLVSITAEASRKREIELIDTMGGKVFHFKMPDCNVTVNAVFEKITADAPAEESAAAEDVTEAPVKALTNNAKDNYSLTCGKVSDMGYTNYFTGNKVFKLDFDFNDLKNAKYRGALLEFVFDAPIGKFLYGADLGNSIVIISPDDPRKVLVNFSTFEAEGDDAPVRSSYLVVSPSRDVETLACLMTKVISVTE